MNIAIFKLVAILAIIATGLLGGLLLEWISGNERSDRLISQGNALAAGTFLYVALLDTL